MCNKMLRIVIHTGDHEKSRKIFAVAQSAVKYAKTKSEVFCAKNADVVFEKLSSPNYYDVLILDALDLNSRKIAGLVRRSNMNASIVFVLDNDINNILSLIKYRPSKVIMEPYSDTDIAKGIIYAIREQLAIRPWFTIKNKESLYRIPYSSINYFESNQRKVILHTDKQVIEFYGKLNDVFPMLPADSFIRCHQSYIINSAKVRKLDKTDRCFVMMNGEIIEISKSQYSQVTENYETFVERN